MQALPELNVEVAADKAKLISMADKVIHLISDDASIARIPRDVRDMAGLIGSLCDQHLPEQKWPLVGGMLLLRLYSPTLISPTTYGLLPSNHPMTPGFRKNLMQVTRLLQNASNHQPFKDGPNVALNGWVEDSGLKIDAFLLKVVEIAADTSSGDKDAAEAAAEKDRGKVDDQKLLRMVQLYVQNKAKMSAQLEKSSDEDFKPLVVEYSDLLSACGNPFRQRTGTVAKASHALNLSIGNMASKRVAEQEDFQKTLAAYRWPTDYTKDYFESSPKPRSKTIMLCMLLSNDKHGVPCAPKVGKKENHLVFVGRDAADWLADNLNLKDRTNQCVLLLQEMVDLDLIIPWQADKKEKKAGIKMEDGDRFYWFDYGSIVSTLESARNHSARSSKKKPDSPTVADFDFKASLSGLQLDKLQRAGILEGGPEDVEPVSSREQWRMLLQVAHSMTFSPVCVAPGVKEVDEETTRFTVGDADGWARRFLGFKTLSQSNELLKTLVNDGFVFADGVKYGFHCAKILSWNEKTFGSRKSLNQSSSGSSTSSLPGSPPESTTPREQPKSARMSLRGAVSRLGGSRNTSDDANPPDRPTRTSVTGIKRGSSSLRNSAPSNGPTQGKTLSRQTSVQMPGKRQTGANLTVSAPDHGQQNDGDDSSSLEERGGVDGENDSVSMLDFLNQDPDSGGELDSPPPPRPEKEANRANKSSASLKSLFSSKRESRSSKSSGGLFARGAK